MEGEPGRGMLRYFFHLVLRKNCGLISEEKKQNRRINLAIGKKGAKMSS